jgi:hypothetical protein
MHQQSYKYNKIMYLICACVVRLHRLLEHCGFLFKKISFEYRKPLLTIDDLESARVFRAVQDTMTGLARCTDIENSMQKKAEFGD